VNVHLERKEAVALLKELGDQHLVQPFLVLIQPTKTSGFQLKIKGDYIQTEIEQFLKNRGFVYEAYENCLIISKA